MAAVRCESELVALAKSGDAIATEELIRQVAPAVRRICRKLSTDPAELDDMVQETLMEIVRLLPTFRGESSLLTWAYMIARTRRSRRLRRRAFGTEPVNESMEATAYGQPDDAFVSAELRDALERALAALSDRDREVLVARDFQGYSASEVAQITGLSVPAVKTRLHRARVAVRAQLLEYVRLPGTAAHLPLP